MVANVGISDVGRDARRIERVIGRRIDPARIPHIVIDHGTDDSSPGK
jgi:hypothetical protein